MTAPPKKPRRNQLLRKRVEDRDHGFCAVCGIYDPKWEMDHELALSMGGKDTLDNVRTLCRRHHRAKTSGEAPVRAKADRLRARAELTRSRRRVSPREAGA